uniref:Uncharacterized protein n=1 Tax=viral metagenome TaxID=1070528 RepID=A0A6C0HGH7_9ZZZZ
MNPAVTDKLVRTLLNYAREQARCKISGPNYDTFTANEIVKNIDNFNNEILEEVNADPENLDSIIDKVKDYFFNVNDTINDFIKSKRSKMTGNPYEKLPSNLYKGLLYGGKRYKTTKRKHTKKSRKSRKNRQTRK